MAYLGRTPAIGRYAKLDDIASSFNGSTTTFNLTSGGDAQVVQTETQLIVSLGGIIQEPQTDYTVSGSQISFTTAPLSGDDHFAILLGDTFNVGVPSDNTLQNRHVKSDAAIAMSKTALVGGTGLTLSTNTLNVDAAQTQITSVGTLTSLAVTGEVTGAGFTGTLDGILGGGTAAAASVTTLGATGVVSFANGSAGAPSIAFSNAPTTGYYLVSAAANRIGLTLAGSLMMDYQESSATTEKLFLTRTANAFNIRSAGTTNTALNLDTTGTGAINLKTNTAIALTINSSQNVGIGTTAPTQKLHVSGNIYTTGYLNTAGSGTSGGVQFADGNLYMYRDSNDLAIKLQGAEKMRINSSGNVGIGTVYNGLFNSVGGSTKLAVVGDSATTAVIGNTDASISIINKNGTLGNTAGLHFARADTDENPNYAGASIVAQFLAAQVTAQYPAADLNFLTSTSQNSAPSLKMTLTASGRLGIGTTAPSAPLSVKGGATAATTLAEAYSLAAINIQPKSSSGYSLSIGSGPSDFPYIQMSAGGSSAHAMSIQPYGGNVGIGTTAPAGKLHVVGGRSFFAANNEKFAIGAKYINTGGLVYFGATDGTSTPGVQISNAGGGALLNILTGGNVGIGTSAPASLFHVKGTQSYGALRLSPTNANGEASIGFYADVAGTTTGTAWVIGSSGWSNTGDFVIGNQAFGGPVILAQQDGKVGIGTTAPVSKVHIIGTSNDTFSSANATLAVQGGGGNGLMMGTRSSTPYTSYVQSGYLSNQPGSSFYNLALNPNGGNVGIGTTTPATTLDVGTSGTIRTNSLQGGYGNSAGNFHIDSKDGTTGAAYINWYGGSGGVVVGNGGSGYGATSASAFNVSSDRRLKENISYFDSGLAQILQLKPATFDFINGENNQKGFIAQDVETVIPEVVGTTTMPDSSGNVDETDEYLTLNSPAMIPYLVAAIQELSAKNDALEARLATLESA